MLKFFNAHLFFVLVILLQLPPNCSCPEGLQRQKAARCLILWSKQKSLSIDVQLKSWDAFCNRINTVFFLLIVLFFLRGAESPVTHRIFYQACSSYLWRVSGPSGCWTVLPTWYPPHSEQLQQMTSISSSLGVSSGLTEPLPGLYHLLVAHRLTSALLQACVIYRSWELLHVVPAAAGRWAVNLLTLCSCIPCLLQFGHNPGLWTLLEKLLLLFFITLYFQWGGGGWRWLLEGLRSLLPAVS